MSDPVPYTGDCPLAPFRLPEGLLLGTATASLQIEGGDRNNTWFRWADHGRIKDNSRPLRSCDHWNRVTEDLALIRDLTSNVHRMSLEWSRIEPAPGQYDEGALDHYRQEIKGMIEIGVIPVVTIHHFSLPIWFEDQGGFAGTRGVECFLRYVEKLASSLGSLVPVWITFNEPNVYLVNGFLFGTWPPGSKSLSALEKTLRNMAAAHRDAAGIIRDSRNAAGHGPASVGVAHHLRVFEPDGSRLSRRPASNLARRFQDRFLDLFHENCTFLGVNYYTRDMVRFSPTPRTGWARLYVKPGRPVSDLGWEIYSEGLYHLCRTASERTGLPVWITENGVCDAADRVRVRYIYDHLYQVARLLSEGIDIRAYLHWSLMDNFEWLEGESARFGLYKVDFGTQMRELRRSGAFFRDLCAGHGVTYEMLEQYLGRLEQA